MSKTTQEKKQVLKDGQEGLKQNKPKDLTKLFDNTSQVLVEQDIKSALDWDKHKPLIVEEQPNIKLNPCILNAGVHQCIVRVIKLDKNNKNDKKDLNNNFTSISDQCGNKNKVVGVNIDFYLQHASQVVKEALQGLIDKQLIATGNRTNRQYFCHKHLVNIFGVVPRQPNSNIPSYNLFACAPFFENEVIATFSSIKFKLDDVKIVGNTNNILVSSANKLKTDDFKIDDKCIRDLGDYVTDPRVILLGTTQYNADLSSPEFKWLANKINVKIKIDNSVYSLVATKNIQAAPGKKKEIQLFADFGIVYWDEFVKNHYKESFHNFRYPLFNFSDNNLVDLKNNKKIYRNNLAKHLLSNFQSDSQQENKNLLKLNSKRLNTLASLIK